MKILLRLLLSITLFSIMINASENAPTKEEVSKLYIATFNRAPDSAGLDYWINDSGLNLSAIAKSFFAQIETKALYPAGTSNGSFINSVYQNLFNRTPDTGGYDYWKSELDSGVAKRDFFILMIIEGALDNENGLDKTILNNKNEVGLYFANKGLDDKNQAKLSMISITADTFSVALMKIKINNNNFSDKIFDINATTITNNLENDIGVVIKSQDEEIVGFGQKDLNGNLISLDGSMFTDPDGNRISIWFGEDGLPSRAIINNITYQFLNYTSNSCDIIRTSANGDIETFHNIDMNEQLLTELKNALVIPNARKLRTTVSQDTFNFIKAASIGISVASCGIGIVTSPTGVGAVVAAVGCTNAVAQLTLAFAGTDDEYGKYTSLVNTGSCILGADVGGCTSTVVDLLAYNLDVDTKEVEEALSILDNDNPIIGNWKGTYSWECSGLEDKADQTNITFNFTNDGYGNLSGTVSFLGSTTNLLTIYEYSNGVYSGGWDSTTTFVNNGFSESDSFSSPMVFLDKDTLRAELINGESNGGCSSNYGPSGIILLHRQ